MNITNGDDFWQSINEGAREESAARKGEFPRTGSDLDPTNYEILPIQELRKQAEKLNIKNMDKLNKQELIEEIRNHKKK